MKNYVKIIFIILILISFLVLFNSCTKSSPNVYDDNSKITLNEKELEESSDTVKNGINFEDEDTATIYYEQNVNEINSNIVNGSYMVRDSKYIYYISREDKCIYKSELDGGEKSVIYNAVASKLLMYEGKLHFIRKKEDKSGMNQICSMDKNGIKIEIVIEDNNILNYNIHEDIIYYNAFSGKISEDTFIQYNIHNLYSYNMKTQKKETVYENIDCDILIPAVRPIIISNQNLYFGILENEKLKFIEYSIADKKKREILSAEIAGGSMINFTDIIVADSKLFFRMKNDDTKDSWKVCSVDFKSNNVELTQIYERNSDNNLICRIAATDDYLFVIEQISTSDGKYASNILRMKHDGSDVTSIAKFDSASVGALFYGYIQIVENKLLVYNHGYYEAKGEDTTTIYYEQNENLPSNIINGGLVVYDENYIYYVNQSDSYNLYKIDIAGKKRERIYNGTVRSLFLKDDEIYFISDIKNENNAIKNELFSIGKNGENLKSILSEDEVLNYSIFENFIYYIAPNGKRVMINNIMPYDVRDLYRCNMDGSEKSLVFENIACNMGTSGMFPVNFINEKIYFGIFKSDTDNLELKYEYIEYDIKSKTHKTISKSSAKAIYGDNFFFSGKDDEKLQYIFSVKVSEDEDNSNTIYKCDNVNNIIMRMAASKLKN